MTFYLIVNKKDGQVRGVFIRQPNLNEIASDFDVMKLNLPPWGTVDLVTDQEPKKSFLSRLFG